MRFLETAPESTIFRVFSRIRKNIFSVLTSKLLGIMFHCKNYVPFQNKWFLLAVDPKHLMTESGAGCILRYISFLCTCKIYTIHACTYASIICIHISKMVNFETRSRRNVERCCRCNEIQELRQIMHVANIREKYVRRISRKQPTKVQTLLSLNKSKCITSNQGHEKLVCFH